MTSRLRRGGRLPEWAVALWGFWILGGSTALAQTGVISVGVPKPKTIRKGLAHHYPPGPGVGTLGYGPPGLHPGFQGFGLGYHLGYGYGGAGLGPGFAGGYPYYGGPGYPQPWPVLRRIYGISPFPYFGGPGGPSSAHPNFFGGVGPLVADKPVIEIEPNPGEADYAHGYGCFTGALPYPETVMAPYTSRAAIAGSASGVSTARPAPPPSNAPAATGALPPPVGVDRALGIELEPMLDPDNTRGLRITKVDPGSVAEKAGLKTGDVILSINGYVTELPANLSWIATNATPDRVLNMKVRGPGGGELRDVTAKIPDRGTPTPGASGR
ncbi:MAG TPA: PDZ domain-containing protein [Isosphaeraceae bacterium]|jgi:hypothetical protein|nr:PDZ domain-containing protein [Isosphaeraceae bacterium]